MGDPADGAVFLLPAGLLAFVIVAVPVLRRVAWMGRRRRAARRPSGLLEPWRLDDVPWRSATSEVRLRPCVPHARPIAATLFTIALLLYVFVAARLVRTEWGLVCAIVSALTGKLLTSRGKAGTILRFGRDPLRVGERAQIDFHFDKLRGRPAVFDRLTLTLRCLTETPRGGGLVRPEVRCLWTGQAVHGDDLPPGPVTVCAAFQLPPDAPGTEVLADPAVFWDLLVEGDGEGFAFRQEFLVPVYAEVARPPS